MRSLGKPWDECAEGTAKAKALRWDPASLGKEAAWLVRERQGRRCGWRCGQRLQAGEGLGFYSQCDGQRGGVG